MRKRVQKQSKGRTLAELLTELENLGIELELRGQQLHCQPSEAVTPELAEEIKSQESELLKILGRRQIGYRLLPTFSKHVRVTVWEAWVATAQYSWQMPRILAEDHAFEILFRLTLAGRGQKYDPRKVPTAEALGLEVEPACVSQQQQASSIPMAGEPGV